MKGSCVKCSGHFCLPISSHSTYTLLKSLVKIKSTCTRSGSMGTLSCPTQNSQFAGEMGSCRWLNRLWCVWQCGIRERQGLHLPSSNAKEPTPEPPLDPDKTAEAGHVLQKVLLVTLIVTGDCGAGGGAAVASPMIMLPRFGFTFDSIGGHIFFRRV